MRGTAWSECCLDSISETVSLLGSLEVTHNEGAQNLDLGLSKSAKDSDKSLRLQGLSFLLDVNIRSRPALSHCHPRDQQVVFPGAVFPPRPLCSFPFQFQGEVTGPRVPFRDRDTFPIVPTRLYPALFKD